MHPGAVEPVAFSVDADALHGELHAPTGRAKGAVLLLHGLNSSLGEFGRFPEELAARGFHVLAFDQRGFGASEGERAFTSVARVLADVDAARKVLRDAAGKRTPMGIIGHSLGGAYALTVLARSQGFQAAVVAHPPDRIWDEVPWVQRPVMHLLGLWGRRRMRNGKRALRVPHRIGYRLHFVDKHRARTARRDDPYLGVHAHSGIYDLARNMEASQWAEAVDVPVLGIWSRADRIVDAESSRKVFDALPGPVERREHHGGHSCFRDLDAPLLLDACDDFLTRHLGGRP